MANPYDDFLSGLKNTVGLTTGLIDETFKKKLGDPYKILNNKNMTPEKIEEVLKDIKDIRKNGLFFLDAFSNPNNPSSKVNLIDFDQGDYDLAKVKINTHGFQKVELYEQQAQALRNIQKYGNKDIMDEMHARQLINESNTLKNKIVNNQSRKPKFKNSNKSYRPQVTMNGNNIEIDSIYNHSIPKKVNKSNVSQPEIGTRRPLTAEEQAAVDKANAQWKADNEARYAEMEKQINDMYKADDEIYGSPEDILNPDYKSKFEPIEETTKKTINSQKKINTNNTKVKNETIEKLNRTKQMYEDILTDWTSASGDFNRQINTRTVGPHNIYTEGKQYLDNIEDLKNNYNVDDYVDGSYTMEQEVFKYSEGKGIDGKDVLKIEGDLVDVPNAYASDLNKTLEEAKKTMSPEEYQRYKNNFDVEGALVKTETGRTKLNRKKVVRNKAGLLDDIGKPGAIMTGLNILGAVGDYKDARRKGHGVISSAARTGVQFAVGEALGLWAIPVMAAKEVPGLVMKGAETLYKENRRMNSAANFQTFGDVQFQDTQQLATMRQSGMEMAKMSQYNLQQTLMGNEATYLHR